MISKELNFDCLQAIFSLLNEVDLQNAAVVCRSWYKAAIYEQVTRGPLCIKRKKRETVPPLRWNFLKLDMIKNCHIPIVFNLFFITSATEEKASESMFSLAHT